jgi:hypothetical protein
MFENVNDGDGWRKIVEGYARNTTIKPWSARIFANPQEFFTVILLTHMP